MKPTIIAALFLAVAVSGKPNQTPSKRDRGSEPKSAPSTAPENNNITAYYAEHPKDDSPQWYAAIKRPEWWLVVIAALTGGAIAYQAREMTRATTAMRESTDVLVTENRPWLLVDKIEEPHLVPPFTVPDEERRFSHCLFKTMNHGKTPAKVIATAAQLQITDNPAMPSAERMPMLSENDAYVFPPGETRTAQATLTPDGFISVADRDEVLTKHTKLLWLVGFIKYRDTFSRQNQTEYQTFFCYRYETRTNAPTPFWDQAGPSGHNRAT